MADNQQKDKETTDQTKETAVADPAAITPETSDADKAEPSAPVEAELPAATSDAAKDASAPGDEPEPSTDTAPAAVGETEQVDAPTATGNGYQAPPPVGYTGEIVGDVIKLEDLEASPEEDARITTYDELRALVEKTLTNVSAHEIVTGRVVSIGEKDVVIDIGFKSDGIISKSEFDHELESGEEVEVYLERIEDYHGQLVLSKSKADKVKRWRRIEDAFENEEVLEGTIVRRIKGGMIVELFEGVEAFLPGSQIDVRPVRDFDAYLEKRMEFKIVKLNPINENIVVSHKALIEKDLQEQRKGILSAMEPVQILEGTVKNITNFGVFIDLGGVDG
ncbi:MAG: S1 RNA-binding domain-containing protein, partial [Rhodothermales bacterium]|nr:S1 RNA-binding domain-containing protein [Rhodothermales bacterium]